MAERRRGRGLAAAVLSAALGLGLAACSVGTPDDQVARVAGGEDSDGMHGTVLDDPYVVPADELRDTDEAPYSLVADTEKPLTLVFFGYTSCPDICQMVMASISSALTRLDDAQRDQVDVVFVTTDPARDDEETLRRYLDNFGDGIVGLTGELDTILDVAAGMHVAVEQGEKLPSGGYDITHGTQVFAVTEEDVAPVFWSQDTTSEQFAEDITQMLAS
ncbi:SCO family protein [Nocardioides pacificus]